VQAPSVSNGSRNIGAEKVLSRQSSIERRAPKSGARKSDKNALHCSGFPSWSDDFFRARASMRRERFGEFSVHRFVDGFVSWSRLNSSCGGREKT
jgi:hypothetical protein